MNLDSLPEMLKLDPAGMLGLARAMPQHVEKALVVSSTVPIGGTRPGCRNVVIGGMGGSAIAGDIAKTLLEERGDLPCLVVREYVPPQFTGPDTLFFCSSYSGNTEETLALYEEAKRRRGKIVCLGSGGELERRAIVDGVPFFKMEGGMPPRAAIGYSFFMIYDVLRRLSLLPEEPGEVEEVITLLREKSQQYGEGVPLERNPAKQLAVLLEGKVVVVYGTRLLQDVALRWKCQFNENSKALAFCNRLPELDHNEIVGWKGLRALRVPVCLVALRDASEHERVSKRITITMELVQSDGAVTREVWSEGKSLVTRIFSLIYLGDFASIYLAFLYSEDPTPVKRIEELKRRLSEEENE